MSRLDELKRKARKLNAELGRTLKEIEQIEPRQDVEPVEADERELLLVET